MKKFIKKYLSLVIVFVLVLGTFAPNLKVSASALSDDAILQLESKGCFDFFWKEANTDPSSPAYGLVRDRALNDNDKESTSPTTSNYNASSVASVGFGLTALTIGAENGWITEEQAQERIIGTLNTLLNKAEEVNGFFYHFLDMNSARRYNNSEVSIIDTAIAVNGAITAGEYFGGEIKTKAQQIYDRVDWNFYVDKTNNQFYMGYSPETGFSGHWDFYAEQLMLYVLGAGSSTHPIDPSMFYSFTRNSATYGNYPKFINSWFGSIFTHQFSFGWIDFNNKIDNQGVNWWDNSVVASKSSRQFSIDQAPEFKTYGPNAWGFTAADGPDGYNGRYGSAPSGFNNDQHFVDGTLAPAGALGSIVFTPEESIAALRNYYENYPSLWGKYGFKDSYNVDLDWYDTDVIGIDKGITLMMIENYKNGGVWNNYMKNKNVQAGMKKVGLKDTGKLVFDDFEGNTLNSGWVDGGDGVYDIKTTNEMSYTGFNSIKVDFNKNLSPGAYMKTTVTGNTVAQGNKLTARVYNASSSPLKFILKFETPTGNHEQSFTINNSKSWEQIHWDISAFKNDLTNINDVQILAAPGESNVTGSFYMDDIELVLKVSASNVFIDGKTIVSETIVGNYHYYNTDGVAEGASEYSWLSSNTVDGEYTDIKGANSKEYTLTSNDVGKYIKFKVKSVSSAYDGGKIYTSEPVLSAASNVVEVATPVVQNLTITKLPVDNIISVDDFNADTVKGNWADSGDKCYTLSVDETINIDGNGALKVDYDKKSSWGFFTYTFDTPQDFSNVNMLNLKANGNPKFLIKFENSTGNGLREKWFDPTTNGWNQLSWDLSSFNSVLTDVKKILIFALPGDENGSVSSFNGTFYFDDLQMVNRTIEDVTKDGIPAQGDTLVATYKYHDAKGSTEGNTLFQWLKSSKEDGQYTKIPKATGSNYTLSAKDKGKFIKVKVTPYTTGKVMGNSVISEFTNRVIKIK